jgi:hypothetical protein
MGDVLFYRQEVLIWMLMSADFSEKKFALISVNQCLEITSNNVYLFSIGMINSGRSLPGTLTHVETGYAAILSAGKG